MIINPRYHAKLFKKNFSEDFKLFGPHLQKVGGKNWHKCSKNGISL